MKILAVDSSGLVASAAVVSEEGMLAEYTINYKKTHSQTLLPMIDTIMSMLEFDSKMLDAIAVSAGPGSFTGLRIGAATAKGLGLAWDKPLISIPTVDAIAYNLFGVTDRICPIMDARRSQVYTGIYSFKQGEFRVLMEQSAMGIEELSKQLNQEKTPVIFLGDGVPVYQSVLKELLSIPHYYAPCHVARQRAGAVGALALKQLADKKTVSAKEFVPVYLRMAQAERERLEKEQSQQEDIV